jgi:competence protein ComEA
MLSSMFAITKLLHGAGSTRERRRWAIGIVAGVAAALVAAGATLGWLALRPARAATVGAAPPPIDAGAPTLALVFVSGAVVHPGLYRLSPDARLADAVAAAGGLTADADPGHMPDLAARVHEGKQVNVPFRRATGRLSTSRLDINTATLDELRAIPTMPLGLADAIVAYREQFGAFRTLSELRTMLGADGPTVTGLRPYLMVATATP